MEDRQPNGGETARGTGPMNVHPRLGGTNTPRNQGDNAESVAPAAGRAYSTERAQGANGGSATSSSRGVDYPSNDSGSAGRM